MSQTLLDVRFWPEAAIGICRRLLTDSVLKADIQLVHRFGTPCCQAGLGKS
jgi:hypothetical protein